MLEHFNWKTCECIEWILRTNIDKYHGYVYFGTNILVTWFKKMSILLFLSLTKFTSTSIDRWATIDTLRIGIFTIFRSVYCGWNNMWFAFEQIELTTWRLTSSENIRQPNAKHSTFESLFESTIIERACVTINASTSASTLHAQTLSTFFKAGQWFVGLII